jgi:hypothetical protein
MNKSMEVLLTLIALAGLYCGIPKPLSHDSSGIYPQHMVTMADGSDPMPLCRGKYCK